MIRLSARQILSAAAILAVGGCASSTDTQQGEDKTIGVATSELGAGDASPADYDFAIGIRRADFRGGTTSYCSGTLVHPRLVITALHCILPTITNEQGDCKLESTPLDPAILSVLVGQDATKPKQLIPIKRYYFDPKAGCDQDIAAIELKEDAKLAKFPALRLDSPAVIDEPVEDHSWGALTLGNPKGNPPTQDVYPTVRQRGKGKVTVIGPGQMPGTGELVPQGYVGTNVAACSGDSGAGVFDSRGALIAVHSASDATTHGCDKSQSFTIPLNLYAPLIDTFFQSLKRMPNREDSPPPQELGGTCTKNNGCHSNLCLQIGNDHVCSQVCSTAPTAAATSKCPSTMICSPTTGTNGVCIPKVAPPEEPSCSVSPTTPSSTAGTSHSSLWTFAPFAGLAAVAVLRARRSKRRLPEAVRHGGHR